MITLSTILYEHNFLNFFNEKNWFWNFEHELITDKLIVINNLSSKELFTKVSEKWSKKYNYRICFVEESENLSIKKFNLNFDKNNIGYVYSIPYYVMFVNTKTKYLLNVATDCMNNILVEKEFLYNSIEELDKNEKCFVTTIPWSEPSKENNQNSCGEHEMISYKLFEYKTDNFYPSYGFSDQFFLTDIKKIEKCDFNSPDSGLYLGPHYCGGICFEKKIIDYLVFSKKFRFIYNKRSYYIHNK